MFKKILIAILTLVLFLTPINQFTDTLASTVRSGFVPMIAKTASTSVLSTSDELINDIRTRMLDRQETMTLRIRKSIRDQYDSMDLIMDEVFAYDDKSTAKDGDYLKFSVAQWDMGMTWSSLDSYAEISLQVTYRTTLEEEQAVDQKVAAVLKALKLENASDVKKVKAIHDYIIKRASYDTSYEKESAYSTLIEKASVCSGYSLAAYRMFTQAGLECRIVSGTGNGGDHAWNIVKVNGKWYNIDLTWDDPIMSDGSQTLVYDYYLKNTKDFTGHKRDAEYRTTEFTKAYPIAKASYQMK